MQIQRTYVGGLGSVKVSRFGRTGMKNRRKTKKRLQKEAADIKRMEKQRRKEERDRAYAAEYHPYDEDMDYRER